MNTTNIIWISQDVIKAIGGQSAGGAWHAKGISIDSRTIQKGDLFIALKGEQGDGHEYVRAALDNGAVCTIVDHVPEGVAVEKCIIVPDTLKAMEALGRAARQRCGGKIIAITGSVGKTGTKELLAAGFESCAQTHASVKSYNNHWGVPLSLARMHAGSDIGVFEVGMNHGGEISPLAKMIAPDIALITTVESVHAENFEQGEAGIADAKAEIFDGMVAGAYAVLNQENKWFHHLKEKAESRGIIVRCFGTSEESDACLINHLNAVNGSRIHAKIMGEDVKYTLQIAGEHIAMNSIAALLAIKLAGGDVQKAAKSMGKIAPLAGRGLQEYIDLGEADNPVTLIDESYNASPVAMRAAFKVLALIDPGRGGRRIAILGDMYELGKDSDRLHEELAMPLEAAGVQLVYTSGPGMRKLYNALPKEKRGGHEDDSRKLAQIVPDVLVPGDVVMVKGSRGGGEKPRMQLVVEALRALPNKFKKIAEGKV